VRGIDMSDTTSIQKVLKEDGDAENQPLNVTGEGPVTSKQIMDQIKFIGDKITDVSRTNINFTPNPPDGVPPIFPIK
jgi:hypothetical protein